MNIDENYRKLTKNENESIRLFFFKKYSLINKLNYLHIKQHYYKTFLAFNWGTSLQSK